VVENAQQLTLIGEVATPVKGGWSRSNVLCGELSDFEICNLEDAS
jgi:hypothetical protein